jgi:hypothetical protein
MLVLDTTRDIARLRSGDRRYRRPRNLVTVARRRRWHEKIGLFVLRREKPSRTRAPNALAVRGDGEALAGTNGRPSACRLRPTGPLHRHGTLRPRNRIKAPVCSRGVARWTPLAGVWVPNHPGPLGAAFGASGMLQEPGSGLTHGYGRTVKIGAGRAEHGSYSSLSRDAAGSHTSPRPRLPATTSRRRPRYGVAAVCVAHALFSRLTLEVSFGSVPWIIAGAIQRARTSSRLGTNMFRRARLAL